MCLPLLGAWEAELLLCVCNVRLRVFCVFILKLASQSPVQFSVSLLPWRSRLGLEALVPLCVSIFGPASCLVSLYRWRGRRTPLGGQALSLQGLELHLDSLWGRSFIHLCTDSAALSCLPLWARHGAVLREHQDDCGPGGTHIVRQDPAGQFFLTIPFLSVPQPHSFLEFKGLCVLFLQPLSLLI